MIASGWISSSAFVLLCLQAARSAELSCKGVPDGSASCLGCSPEFNGDACGACLMETLNAAQTCTACESERPTGDTVTVDCGPTCYYCRACDLNHLAEMRTSGAVVQTCRCNSTRLRAAAADSSLKGAELLDGAYGVVQVQPEQSVVSTVDGLSVRVTCAKVAADSYRTIVTALDERTAAARSGGDTCVEKGNTYRVVPYSGCSLFVQTAGPVSEVHACPPPTAFDVQACTCAHRRSHKCCL